MLNHNRMWAHSLWDHWPVKEKKRLTDTGNSASSNEQLDLPLVILQQSLFISEPDTMCFQCIPKHNQIDKGPLEKKVKDRNQN